MERKMTFYSEGFFGYGDPGNYIPYGLDYFIPILILIGCSVLVILKRRQIRTWLGEGRLRFVLGFIIIIVEMSYFWRLLYVGLDNSGDTSLLTRLPIQLCEWGAICSAFMVMSLNDTLFGINYFITFIVFFPNTSTQYSSTISFLFLFEIFWEITVKTNVHTT